MLHMKKYSKLLGVAGLIFYFILVIRTTAHLGPLGWDEAVRSMGGIILYRLFTTDKPLVEIIQLLYANHQLATFEAAIYGPVQALISFISYLLFGISPFTARLPSAVFGTLGLYVCYLLGKEVYKSEKIGIFSAILMAGSLLYFKFNCLNWSEAYTTVFVLVGIYFLVLTRKECAKISEGRERTYLFAIASGLFLAFGSLIKPSIAIILMPVVIYVLLLVMKNKLVSRKSVLLLSLPVLIAIGIMLLYYLALYFLPYWILPSGSLQVNALAGYLSFWTGRAGHPPPISFTSVDIWADFWKPLFMVLPISSALLSIGGVFYALRKREHEEDILLACYAIIFFVAFAFSGTISANYSLPALPALCVLGARILAIVWDRSMQMDKVKDDKMRRATCGLILIFTLFLIIQSFYVPVTESLSVAPISLGGQPSYSDPYLVRGEISKYAPYLFMTTTGYCLGPDWPALESNNRCQIDPIEWATKAIVQDADREQVQKMTVLIVDDGINTIHFEFWFMALDTHITYTSKIIKPGELLDCLSKDENIGYIVTSETGLPSMYQNEHELYFTMENVNVFRKM